MKIYEFFTLAIIGGLLVVVGQYLGYKDQNFLELLFSMSIIIAIGGLGFCITKIPYANKIPSIAWVSVIAVFSSSPWFLYSDFIVSAVSKIEFMAVTTPTLAYAGLSIGKELDAFKSISWKIIPVALAAIAGVFICAATIAQIALTLSGNI